MNLLMRRRQAKVLARVEQLFRDEGRTEDAALLAAIRRNDEAMTMWNDESTAAFAKAEGIDATALEERGRPFLDFLQTMLDGQVFRKFAEWVFEHKEEILELAKMIAAIIGIFA